MNKLTKIALAIILPTTLALTGCAVHTTSADPSAAVATSQPSSATPNYLKSFGDVITWKDGLSVSVSAPTPYTPSESAAGAVAGQPNLQFTVLLTNNSKVVVKPIGYPNATSGGQSASSIVDFGANVGNTPADVNVLPGQSLQWIEAFSVIDPTDITFTYSPGFEYKDAIFTTQAVK